VARRALPRRVRGWVRSASSGRFELAMRRYAAATTQSSSRAVAIARWLRADGRGCGLRERSGDAAGAERAGQKLHELQRAATVWIGDWKRRPRCEGSIIWDKRRARAQDGGNGVGRDERREEKSRVPVGSPSHQESSGLQRECASGTSGTP
jgi:hypothetical protein